METATIIQLGETAPYFIPSDSICFDNGVITAEIGTTADYEGYNFSKLIQHISSIGSCGLYHCMGKDSKTFFLGEKLRIRRMSYNLKDGRMKVRGRNTIESERKGKTMIEVYDCEDQLAYTYELDYHVFTEKAFQGIFEKHYNNTEGLEVCTRFPTVSCEGITPESFTMHIGAFSKENCMGHFDNYPIVPAVYITNRLLEGIHQWLKSINDSSVLSFQVDSAEGFLLRGVPVDTDIEVKTEVFPLLNKLKMFRCTVMDSGQNVYGIYLLTVEDVK